MEYGEVVSVPIEVPLAKNWTCAIVPSASAAVAVTVVAVPTAVEPPLAGVVTETVGEAFVATVTLTLELVAWLPAESVASAVSE